MNFYKDTQMKDGILEVLLVNAEGIRHTNIVGTPAYHVLVECGSDVYRSKISSVKDEKAWWNEKFTFEFSLSDWKNYTHLKFKIMDKELFTDGGFVGETIIYLGGIIFEAYDRGFIEITPAPYSVVLEDDSYKGQIVIGLKFIANNEDVHDVPETRELQQKEVVKKPRQSICSSITNLWRILWSKLLFTNKPTDSKHKKKYS